jgi:hypothetical protein
MIERIIFGDNQFFGINHMSEEKARAQSLKFKDTASIIKVLDNAYDLGIKTFMCTTHDRIADVCNHLRANPEKYSDYTIYPCLPYAHKYNDAVTEMGLLGALSHFTKGDNVLGLLLEGGLAASKSDVKGIMKILIDQELKMFKGINTPVIFIQNVLLDLLLGLGFKDIIRAYADYIKEKYKAEPGFITMNLPLCLSVLKECGIDNPIVCCNINKIGFRMSGGNEVYEKLIREQEFQCIAMSVFASGAIGPKEAFEYVSNLKGLNSIVFGASSKDHIEQNKLMIDEALSKGEMQ